MVKNIKKNNPINIQTEINDLRKSLLNLRFQKTTGQLEKTFEIRKAKKKIAMLLTQMNKNKIQNV